jgi:uncharacterized protein (DUF362 family)
MAAAVVEFRSYGESVKEALDSIGAAEVLKALKAVMVKPNLTQASPFPITTPVAICEAIVAYVRACSGAEVVIAEGCGAISHETGKSFRDLGYTDAAKRLGVRLVDLNNEKTVKLTNPACRVFPEFHLPEIALSHYIICVPVLKAHSFSKITGTMKNMMGLAPPQHYSEPGHWKKAKFHARMHEAIMDLNRYRTPDLSVVDATVGMAEFHLGGAHCNPPVNRIVAGFDPVEVDRISAELLGFEWKKIPHLVPDSIAYESGRLKQERSR